MASIELLVLGLVLFIGIHLLPMAPGLRAQVATRLGEGPYRGLFALVSAAGLVLIVVGWPGTPERVEIFAPIPAARVAAPLAVSIAFVLFAAANMRTHIRVWLRHPMLIGLLIWSGVHLLANGDFAGTVLFGSFAAYSVVAIASAEARGAVKPVLPAWKHDAFALVAGLLVSYLVMRFHAQIFGTSPVI
jgi:uncharacterized membrane protein